MKKIEIIPKLNAKQKKALRLLMSKKDGPTEVLFGGAAGGGKTFLGAFFLMASAINYPETRWLMGRSRLSLLKGTTLKTFFEVCKMHGVIKDEHFTINNSSNVIKFFNGSEIILKDLFEYPTDKSYDSLGGLELSGGFVDECNQITEKCKNVIVSRIRYNLDKYGLKSRLLLACNPAQNWVMDFYKKKLNNTLPAHQEFIQALVDDNEFIDSNYKENLGRLDEITKRRLLYGEWEYDNSANIFLYDPMINMFDSEVDADPNGTFYLSIDVARLGKDKTCILVWNDLVIVDFMELSRLTLDVQKSQIDVLIYKYNVQVSNIVIDTDGVGGGLADMYKGCVHVVNNSRPRYNENYFNLKNQLYFKLAEMINSNHIRIKIDNLDFQTRLLQELQIIKREKIDSDGKIRMTTKEAIKSQLNRSPDISDAMAFKMIYHLTGGGYNVYGGANSHHLSTTNKSKMYFDVGRLKAEEGEHKGGGEDDGEYVFFR